MTENQRVEKSTVIVCDICHSGSTDERRFTYCKDCGAVCPNCQHTEDCTDSLTNAAIELIQQAYPEKTDSWARYYWQRCVNNIDEDLTSEVMFDLLKSEFDISPS